MILFPTPAMQSILLFIRSRQFLVNLGFILLFIFLLFFGVIKWLSSYTHHGEFVTVPDFSGQLTKDLPAFSEGKGVSWLIIDSIYDPKEKPGIVLRQEPEPDSKVKHNRTVYLYVTGMVAPQIAMPKLIDRSERQARLILLTYGLKPGHITEKRADCNGCVLSQLSKGHEVAPGEAVKKGSVIDLVIGRKDTYYTASSDSGAASVEEPLDFD